jgi:hypothetical protein
MNARGALTVALISAWLGASMLFALNVAPTAFAVLPSRALAGALVGQVLPVLFFTGLFLGAADFLAEQAYGRNRRWLHRFAALLLAASCAAAQFAVAPRIHRLREAIGPSLDALAADDPRRLAFGRLHAISVGFLGVAMLAALVVVVVAARTRTPNDDR